MVKSRITITMPTGVKHETPKYNIRTDNIKVTYMGAVYGQMTENRYLNEIPSESGFFAAGWYRQQTTTYTISKEDKIIHFCGDKIESITIENIDQ